MAERKSMKLEGSAGAVVAMGGCFALGTFADNFYKQAVVLMAAHMGEPIIQSVAAVLFSLPYVLFSAWAGRAADALPKSRIVFAAKVMEFGSIALGAISLYWVFWPGVLASIFLMGVQGTAFSPALNGSIPECFPAHQVPRVNSLIKLASTCAVVAGIACAGIALAMRPGGLLPNFGLPGGESFGRAATGGFALAIAVVGLCAALFIPRSPKGTGRLKPFPWWGPVDSTKQLIAFRADPQLFTCLMAEGFFYGVSSVAVISVANLSEAFDYGTTLASLFAAALMIGIGVGAVFVGRYPAESWRRFLVPASRLMGFFLLLTAASTLMDGLFRIVWLFVVLSASGFCGGIYLIPLTGFLQLRPKSEDVGKVLGVSNFFTFVAIAAWGAVFGLISLLPPSVDFVVYAASLWCFAQFYVRPRVRRFEDVSLADLAPSPAGFLMKALLSLRYRVRDKGLDAIPANLRDAAGKRRPILFLPNHPALIDPPIVLSRLAGLRPRPLADTAQMTGLLPGLAAKFFRVITIPDVKARGRNACDDARKGLERVVETLQAGDDAILYPAGGLSRDGRERLGANSAAARVLAGAPEARVVLLRSEGLWGSSFSRAGGRNPNFFPELLRGLGLIACRGIFFLPRRPVNIEYMEIEDLPRNGDKAGLNRLLEAFYNEETEKEKLPVQEH